MEEWTKDQFFEVLLRKLSEVIQAINSNLWPAGGTMNLFKELPTGVEPGQPMIDYPYLKWLPGFIKKAVTGLRDNVLSGIENLRLYCFEFSLRETGGLDRGTVMLRFWRLTYYTSEPLTELVKEIKSGGQIFGGLYCIPLNVSTDQFSPSVCDDELDRVIADMSKWLVSQSSSIPDLREYDFEFTVLRETETHHSTLMILFWRSGRKASGVPRISPAD